MRVANAGAVLAAAVVAVLVLPTVAAGHGEPHQVREERHDVWTQWTVAHSADSGHYLDDNPTNYTEGTPAFTDGDSPITDVKVRNQGSTTVWNATLVAQVSGVDVRTVMTETMAGDPPQVDYAYWDVIPPEDVGAVPMAVEAPTDVAGPFTVDFVLFFEGPDGTQYYNVTTYEGVVEDRNDVVLWASEHLPDRTPAILFASLPLLVGLAALAWRARRAEPGA